MKQSKVSNGKLQVEKSGWPIHKIASNVEVELWIGKVSTKYLEYLEYRLLAILFKQLEKQLGGLFDSKTFKPGSA